MLSISNKEFWQLSDYIKSNYGIHLKEGKKALITGRLQNVLMRQGFESFSDFYEYVVSDKTGQAATTLVNKITTNHTFFMREREHFHYFRSAVLPYLARITGDRDLRVWSAGCSSGEEPYTLAMIIDEFFGDKKGPWNTKLLATDISAKVLRKAALGHYSNESLASLPEPWRRRYFREHDGDTSAVIDSLKDEVIFRKFNLMERDFPFKKKFHVIFCKNVMIYFDQKTRTELVEKFYEATGRGGYLFIGLSESIKRQDTKYEYIAPGVYRKG